MLLIENPLTRNQMHGLILSPVASNEFLIKQAKFCVPDIARVLLRRVQLPKEAIKEIIYSFGTYWAANKAYIESLKLFENHKNIPQSFKTKLFVNIMVDMIFRRVL